MSATTFAGSAQFAVISVLGAGGTLVAAVAASGSAERAVWPDGPRRAAPRSPAALRRVLESQLLVDESGPSPSRTAASTGGDAGAGMVLYVGWLGGTALGVAAGTGLGDPAVLGLDAAFPALFLALMVPLIKSRNALAAAVAGAGLALLLTPLTPAGVPVIAATPAVLFGLFPSAGAR